MEVVHTTSHFENSRHTMLYYQSWIPKEILDNPSKMKESDFILLIHGYSNHSHNQITRTGKWLAERGLCSFALDLESHGFSRTKIDGEIIPHCYITNVQHFVQDIISLTEWILFYLYPGCHDKLYLAGESMGGGMSAHVALIRGDLLKGVILLVPLIGLQPETVPPYWQIIFLNLIAPLFPTAPLIPAPDPRGMYRDPIAYENDQNDPLIYHNSVRLKSGIELYRLSLSFFSSSLSSLWSCFFPNHSHSSEEKVKKEHICEQCSETGSLGRISIPVLILLGSQDSVCSVEHSSRFFERSVVTNPLSQLKVFEGVKHAILQDPDQEVVKENMLDWIHRVSSS